MGTFNLAPTGSATYDTDDDEGAQVCKKKVDRQTALEGFFTTIMVYISSLEKRWRLKFCEKMIREPLSFWESAGFVGEIQMR